MVLESVSINGIKQMILLKSAISLLDLQDVFIKIFVSFVQKYLSRRESQTFSIYYLSRKSSYKDDNSR